MSPASFEGMILMHLWTGLPGRICSVSDIDEDLNKQWVDDRGLIHGRSSLGLGLRWHIRGLY